MIVNDGFELNHATRICFGPGVVGTNGKLVKEFGNKAYAL